MSLAIHAAVTLLQCIGVGGCLCPIISSRAKHMILPSLRLRERAPSSASTAEATTNLRIPHKIKIDPFNAIGWPFSGILPKKNWPATRLLY